MISRAVFLGGLALLAHGQTQIDLTRQVRSTLPYSSGGTSAVTQIAARQNVGMPELVATDFSGADIGEKVNNAFASFSAGQCGTVKIPAGTYTYATTIYVPSSCILQGVGRGNDLSPLGTTLIYNGPPATAAIAMMHPNMTASYFASVQNLSIYTNAGACPNNGMLAWNSTASGANKWQCFDDTTYTAPVPHLAAILHGQIDPTILSDGAHIVIRNVDVNGGTGGTLPQGAYHFGVYLNGCEECLIEAVYALYPDEGFYIGGASNGILFNQITARLNRRSGFHYRGSNAFQCNECLFESNGWFGQPPDPPKYGAGIRISDEHGVGEGRGGTFISTYFESNAVDVVGGAPRSQIQVGNFNSIRGQFGTSKLTNCTISDASLITLNANTDFYVGCQIVSGAFVIAGASARIYHTDPLGTLVTKINRDYGDGTTRHDFYELDGDNTGGPSYQYFRGSEFRLDTHRAASSTTNRDSPALSFKGTKWNGAASEDFRWMFIAQAQTGSGPPESTPGLYLAFNSVAAASTRRFAFREDGEMRVLKPNGQITIGETSADNGVPRLHFLYASAADTTGGRISATRQGEAANQGLIFIDAQKLQIQGGGSGTTLVVKGDPGQSSTSLQQWQNDSGTVLSRLRADGAFQTQPQGSKPACNLDNRFTFWTEAAGAGQKDTVEVCAKDASDGYAWRAIY